MINRYIKHLILSRLDSYPAVALLGPRQSGKTTLAKTLGPHYFDLELPEGRTRLDVQWPVLIRQDELIILDEAQSRPEFFPRIRSAIDGRASKERSISPARLHLTGSDETGFGIAGRPA